MPRLYVNNAFYILCLNSNMYIHIYNNIIYRFLLYVPGNTLQLFLEVLILLNLERMCICVCFPSIFIVRKMMPEFLWLTYGKKNCSNISAFCKAFYSLLIRDNPGWKYAKKREVVASVLNTVFRVGCTHSFFRPLGHRLAWYSKLEKHSLIPRNVIDTGNYESPKDHKTLS
jgi:hypothetical protein